MKIWILYRSSVRDFDWYNAPVPYHTMQHFVTEMCAHSVTKWGIVEYLFDALWALWDGSVGYIVHRRPGRINASWLLQWTRLLYSWFWHISDILPPNFVKSRSREIGCYNARIAPNFDRHLGSSAAELPVKFQSDRKSLNPNLAASRLNKILR